MFYRRTLLPELSGRISEGKIRILFSARQTGKTALLREVSATSGVRFFNLQDSQLRRRFESDPASFSREVQALPPTTRIIVVDEIQKVPALLDELQNLYDADPKSRQYFLTGSSSRRLRTGSSNLLPGRSHVYSLHPICQWEVEGTNCILAPSKRLAARSGSRRGKPPAVPVPGFPRQSLERTLLYGCLPGVRLERSAMAAATLSSYVELYLEEEIRREALVRDLGPFAVYLRLAAAESGSQVNLAKLSSDAGIAASTIKTYYQTLVDTFAGFWMQPYARRTRKRLLTTPRFYVFDVGVRNAAAELPLERGLLRSEGGRLLEHWVAQELTTRAAYLGSGHRVTFWRTTSGAEVDFIWESAKEDIPIEVKWTERPKPADARHVETFLDEYAPHARRGFVVCRCPEPQQLTDRVVALPWERL